MERKETKSKQHPEITLKKKKKLEEVVRELKSKGIFKLSL